MFLFAKYASSIMRIEKVDEMIEVTNISNIISNEIKDIPFDRNKYKTNINLKVANKESSPALLALHSELSPSLQNSLPAESSIAKKNHHYK